MKRLALMPLWLALITFLLVFTSLFVELGSLKTIFARRELASQTAMMLRGFREGYESARLDLAKLPRVEELNCKDGISPQLARNNFDNQYIRWFGVAQDGNVICRGGPVGITLSASQSHRIDDVWSLLSLASPGQLDNLVVAQRRGDALYLAMLEPLLFDSLHSSDCRACVSYQLIVKADPEVGMKSEDTSDPAVMSYTLEGVRLGTYMKFTLSATQQYVDGFSVPGRFLSAAIAALTATAFALALYWHLMRRTSLAFLIKEGLKRKEFVPYYQPIMDSRDGSLLGAEALARWLTKGEKLIPPVQFIPYAEENHLIDPITYQLVESILLDMKRFRWQDTSRYISINVTAEQITDSPFCEKLILQLAESNVASRNLSIEITERHQFADLERGRIALQRLVDAGIRITLDDAGAGYGGFSYLQELPIKALKIDKIFVDTLRRERGDPKQHVLFAVVEFAKAAGVEVTAEGVETQDQVARLKDVGVYAIQGFVYARPMPAEEFVRWIQAHIKTL